jgi:hypothetical protein
MVRVATHGEKHNMSLSISPGDLNIVDILAEQRKVARNTQN